MWITKWSLVSKGLTAFFFWHTMEQSYDNKKVFYNYDYHDLFSKEVVWVSFPGNAQHFPYYL